MNARQTSALGVDVGGTFTDLVWWDGQSLMTAKTLSTPDQSVGVVQGARSLLSGSPVDRFLHGTTVATNALLERRGAKVAFVTTAGFEDTIEIARQERPSLYDPFANRASPLVGREARFGIRRVEDADEWTDAELQLLSDQIAEFGPDSVAISLLYGYAGEDLERRVEVVVDVAQNTSLSSQVAPEIREYERASTTIVNAFLTPETATYLDHLKVAVGSVGLPDEVMVMRSSGGLISIDEAAALPVSILLSGPAGGVVASAAIGEQVGTPDLISFDMGGTSTDVCRIDGGVPEATFERNIEGLAVLMPSVAIHTVGAGGGSVGWIDPGGALRVGPASAGANPGPAAYGRGGRDATVTDANIWLGRIGPDARLAGNLGLDVAEAGTALTELGQPIGLNPTETALGILEIVEAHMERAIRKVSVEEGSDPRASSLIAFGGAGALHATALARRLQMSGVIIPPLAGVFSAFGLLLSPPRIDRAMSGVINACTERALLTRRLAEMVHRATDDFRADVGEDPREVVLSVDVRYIGQAHETSVQVATDIAWEEVSRRFHIAHDHRNGFSRPEDPIEIITVRAAALGDPAVTFDDLPEFRPVGEPEPLVRNVVGRDGTSTPTDVWWRPSLPVRFRINGPAVVEETEATSFLAVGETLTVHGSGALQVTW